LTLVTLATAAVAAVAVSVVASVAAAFRAPLQCPGASVAAVFTSLSTLLAMEHHLEQAWPGLVAAVAPVVAVTLLALLAAAGLAAALASRQS
jgi:hypothetical protein